MFIRTDRLFLRPAWAEDAPALFAGIADWDVVRMLARAPWPYTLADAEAKIARPADPGGESFLIFERRARGVPPLVGSIGFGRWLGPDRDPEIGYWLARPHWGKGYATEAGRAVLELAFEAFGLPLLGAGHYIDNAASGVVLKKLGFEETGEVIPYPCLARGHAVDSVEYRLTREAWAAQRARPRVTEAA